MRGAVRMIYDMSLACVNALNTAVAPMLKSDSQSKTMRFLKGRGGLMKQIRENLHIDSAKQTIWVHAASLGEFGIARPIISRLQKDFNIVITFFSPSGLEAVKGKYTNTFYIPWDTRSNARKFLDIIRPAAALFMVSEYWHNYLSELKSRGIPAFLVSAIISADSVFFKRYGGEYQKSLASFHTIFTSDPHTLTNLKQLKISSGKSMGDPLFDNARLMASTPYINPLIERFKGDDKLFVAGSISDENDLQLIAALANDFRDVKFLLVPHETDEKFLALTSSKFTGKVLRFSECDDTTDFTGVQSLMIDYVGDLSKIYRYGTWAYVGGGFTPYLHSVIEATVYGLPVSFGPQIKRKVTPARMIELGIGAKVGTYSELKAWFVVIKDDDVALKSIKAKASAYLNENTGVTSSLTRYIISHIRQ